jgi:hypothetical protein
VDDDLTAETLTSSDVSIDQPQLVADEQRTLLGMILVRYPDSETARQLAMQMSSAGSKPPTIQIELVLSADRDGHRHASDPTHGVAAMTSSDVISWGACGLIFGAVSGGLSGGGVVGLIGNALLTRVAWGVFGLVAGMLYGLWAGQVISARRLRRVGPLLAPGTSMLLVWADEVAIQSTLQTLSAPGSKHVVLRFQTVPGGVVLGATNP